MSNKSIFKNSLILYLRLGITTILSILTSRFVLQNLGASDFGLFNVVAGIIIVFAILNNVMTSTTYTFLAKEIGRGDLFSANRTFNISLGAHILIGLILYIIVEILGKYYVENYLVVDRDRIETVILLLRLSALATSISVFSIPYQGLLTAFERFDLLSIVEVIRSILGFLLGYSLFFVNSDKLVYYTWVICFVNIIPSILFWFFCKCYYSLYIKEAIVIDLKSYKRLFSFSGFVLFNSGAAIGQRQGTDLIVNYFHGTILNASLGIANQVNNLILFFAKNLGQAAVPQITKSFVSNDLDRSINLTSYISKYTSFLMLAASAPIFLNTEFILKLWLGPIPEFTVVFCQLLIIHSFFESLIGSYTPIIMASGKMKIFVITGMFTMLTLFFCFLINFYKLPLYYTYYIYIFFSFLNLLLVLFFIRNLSNISLYQIFRINYSKVIQVLFVFIPICFVLRNSVSKFWQFLLCSAGIVVFLCCIIYFLGMDKKEKLVIKTFFYNNVKRVGR